MIGNIEHIIPVNADTCGISEPPIAGLGTINVSEVGEKLPIGIKHLETPAPAISFKYLS